MIIVRSIQHIEWSTMDKMDALTCPNGCCPGGRGPLGPAGLNGVKGSNLAPGGTPLQCHYHCRG